MINLAIKHEIHIKNCRLPLIQILSTRGNVNDEIKRYAKFYIVKKNIKEITSFSSV